MGRMLVLAGMAFKLVVDLMISVVNHLVIAKVQVLRLADHELDNILTDRGVSVLPEDREEKVLEIATTLSFPFAFCSSLAAKLLLTALPGWEQVLLMASIMAVVEVTVTFIRMKVFMCRMHGGDRDEGQTRDDNIHLALTVTKVISEMSVEYLVMSTTVVAAVIYRNSDTVTGFGGYHADEAIKVWLAQV